MSHRSGDIGFGDTSTFQMRWMPPRSMSTNMPAQQMHTVDRMMAGTATFLNCAMWNTDAEEATISPPADRPTKNMKQVM